MDRPETAAPLRVLGMGPHACVRAHQSYQIQWYHALCVFCCVWVFLLFSAALFASALAESIVLGLTG